VEHWEDPGIIEATLHIGHLEGVWQVIYDRREAAYTAGLAAFAAAWATVWRSDGIADLVHSVRGNSGPAESKSDDRPDPAEEFAVGLVLSMLQGFVSGQAWQQLRLAVGEAMATGRATGVADAMELLADKIGATGFNFSKAFADAKRMFDNDPQMLAEVDQWLSFLVEDTARILGKKLAKMAKAGASAEEMEQYIREQIGDGDKGLLQQLLDLVIHTAITYGLLWFFRNWGVAQVWFITAGDDKVCPECDAIEQENPYSISDPPLPPIHPNCRCSLFTEDEIQADAISAYLD